MGLDRLGQLGRQFTYYTCLGKRLFNGVLGATFVQRRGLYDRDMS